MFVLKDILRFPDDSLAGSTGLSEDLALLNEEEEKPEKPEKEDEEGLPPGDDEHQEVDEKEEEPETPKELLPHDRPTYTDLKEYDAELFKNFPGLKDVIFREKAYTDLFTNIDDAKSALENSQALESARESIFTGDGVAFLNSIKETDEKALIRFSQRILPALNKVSLDAHWAAANPILESMVRGFHSSAKDDKTKEAAKLFADFMFGDQAQDILDGKKTFIPTIEEQKKDPEREQFERERYSAFDSDVRNVAFNGLSLMIDSKDKNGKSRVDPDDVFSPWLKKTLIEKISLEVQSQMQSDKDHIRYMNGLWDKAKKNGYKSEWKTSITTAFLARARQLVPTVRSQIISEALGRSKKAADKTREVVNRTRRPEAGGGGSSSKGSGFNPNKKIDYNKTSDDDLINDNITYRG